MTVAGPVSALTAAFGTELSIVASPNPTGGEVTHRYRSGGLQIPAELDGIVRGRPRPGQPAAGRAALPVRRRGAAAKQVSYTPPQVAELYQFPAGTDGTGQTIAIIELGGGFGQSDLDSYFSGLGHRDPVGHRGRRRRRQQRGRPGPAGRRRRGAARHRGGRRGRTRRRPGRLLRAEHRPGLPGRGHDRGARAADAGRDQHQLGPDRETPGPPRPRPRSIRPSPTRSRSGVTVTAWRPATTAAATACTDGTARTSTSPRPARTRSAAAAPACTPTRPPAPSPPRRCGTTAAAAARRGGGVSDTFAAASLAGRAPASPRARPAIRAGACRTWPGTPTRTPAIRCWSTGSRRSSAARARSRRCGRRSSAGWRRRSGQPSAWCRTPCTRASSPAQPRAGLRDITTGINGAYQAGPGWDACTGLGVPDGSALLAGCPEGLTGGTARPGPGAAGGGAHRRRPA